MEEKKRTSQQNRALHLYFETISKELNDAGLDMKTVLKPEIDIPWTKDTVKDYLWRPVQKALLGKESTTKLLKNGDIEKIIDILQRHLGDKIGFTLPSFPSFEVLMLREQLLKKRNEPNPTKIKK